MTDTPRNVVRALRKIGFIQVRARGSHRYFKRGTVVIPVPDHPGDMNQKTFHRIPRLAGLTVEDYRDLR